MFPGMGFGGGGNRFGQMPPQQLKQPMRNITNHRAELQPFRGTMGPESIMPRNLSFGRFDR
jgi:hypothetical protein